MGGKTESTNSRRSGARLKLLPLLVVVALVFFEPALNLNRGLSPTTGRAFSIPEPVASGILAFILDLKTSAVVVIMVVFWEGLPLSSIGIHFPRMADFPLALAVAAIGVCLDALLQLHPINLTSAAQLAANAQEDRRLYGLPSWLRITMALSAGISEEIAARAYLIERLWSATHSAVLAASFSSIASALAHVPNFGPDWGLGILPGQVLLALLYLWRRNLWTCAAAHFLGDAFSMVLWPVLPDRAQDIFWRAILTINRELPQLH